MPVTGCGGLCDNARPLTIIVSAFMEDRLTELEIKLSFTEDLVDSLNLTVYRQQQTIDQLIMEMRSLRQQFLTSLPAEARNLADEIPPHY